MQRCRFSPTSPKAQEESARKSNLHHLEIALGSQAEVDTQLEIAVRLGFFDRVTHRRLASRTDEVGKMLNGLITSLQPEDDEQ